MPVNAAVALLHPVGVPGQLEVNQVMAVFVQVEAFAGNVGGDQESQGALACPGHDRFPRLLR